MSSMDPNSFTSFGELLRFLRQRARLSQRQLGIAVGYSDAQITRLENSQRLPDPTIVRVRFLEALDLQNEPTLAQRLIELAEQARGIDGARPAPPQAADQPVGASVPANPYRAVSLPVQLTRFIGREKDIADLQRLLTSNRLVTLTGAGGVGKTRLAIEVGASIVWASHHSVAQASDGFVGDASPLPAFPDGVWLAELAAISEPSLVPVVLTRLFGLVSASRSAQEVIIDHLRSRHLLLILDNCEHLIAECTKLVETLLRSCPRLHILATSREALNIPGEVRWRVPPLAPPEGVALFAERACDTQPDFVLDDRNTPTVEDICARLDHIPLAIELAAARLHSLSIEELASRMGDRFHLLTDGSRTALPRHQTLRNLIDWSYELLSEPERKLLRRLSVFANGWVLVACEDVCTDGNNADILSHLHQLVAKSLVVADTRGPETRYRLHETIREYAREKLAASGESILIGRRHTTYYLALAQQAEPQLTTALQEVWLERLEVEHDNLRTALEWCQAQGDGLTGMQLVAALWRYWFLQGHFDEGRHWIYAVLASREGSPTFRARVLVGASFQAVFTGDYARGELLCAESLAAARAAGDKTLIALALILLGDSHSFITYTYDLAVGLHEEGLALARESGNQWLLSFALAEFAEVVRKQNHDQQAIAKSIAHLQESLALARESGDRWLIAFVLFRLGSAMTALGDFPSAHAYHREGLAIRRAMGDRLGVAYALLGLARTAEAQGDGASAQAYLQERLALERELGNLYGVGYSFNDLGLLALRRGAYEQAQAYLEESTAIFKHLQAPRNACHQLLCLALVNLMQGDYTQAQDRLAQSLALNGMNPDILICALEVSGRLVAGQGQPARAARMFGAVEAIGETVPHMSYSSVIRANDPEGYVRSVAAVRAELGEEAFQTCWSEGRSMTADQAVAYARQVCEKDVPS